MLIRRRKKEDADDIVTRVGDYNNAAALNYEPRDIGPVPPDYGVLFVVFSLMLLGCIVVVADARDDIVSVFFLTSSDQHSCP